MEETAVKSSIKPDDAGRENMGSNTSRELITGKGPYSEGGLATGDSSSDENQASSGKRHKESIHFLQGKEPLNQVISLEMEHMKRYALARFIEEDPRAADLKWSLFCAACQSYRYDSALKPFPPFFVTDNGHKDINRLREVAESCPTMSILLDLLQDRSKEMPLSLVAVLYWVLIHLNEPQLKYIPKSEHGQIITLVEMSKNGILPNHILEVMHNDLQEQKFNSMREEFGTKFAYHGSRLDNFYSILNHGLQISLNKVAAFGPGVYLSSEMNISLSYSPTGFGWGASYFGSRLSVLALCEMVDHPDVKFQNGSKENFCKMIAQGSENGPVPKKYFIVQNSDLVRIRYLLLFSNDGYRKTLAEPNSMLGWIKEHKMITIILGYVILLLAVGTSNSAVVYRYYKRFLRKIF